MTRRMATLLPALCVCGALAATGIFHTWQRVEGIRLSYRLGEVTSEHRTILGRNEHLRLEYATLKAPSRIERLAREELGMGPPRPSQVVVVRARPAASASQLASRDQSAGGDDGNGLSSAIAAADDAREGPRG